MEGKISVLLVDDEIDFIDMMRFWLQQRNFDVDVLYSGDGVVERVKEKPYHLMFLDLKLPGVSGIDILKKIREFSKLPVIIFSAYGTMETMREATALKISGFFAKEKGFDEAARLIHTALRIHKGISVSEGGGKADGA